MSALLGPAIGHAALLATMLVGAGLGLEHLLGPEAGDLLALTAYDDLLDVKAALAFAAAGALPLFLFRSRDAGAPTLGQRLGAAAFLVGVLVAALLAVRYHALPDVDLAERAGSAFAIGLAHGGAAAYALLGPRRGSGPLGLGRRLGGLLAGFFGLWLMVVGLIAQASPEAFDPASGGDPLRLAAWLWPLERGSVAILVLLPTAGLLGQAIVDLRSRAPGAQAATALAAGAALSWLLGLVTPSSAVTVDTWVELASLHALLVGPLVLGTLSSLASRRQGDRLFVGLATLAGLALLLWVALQLQLGAAGMPRRSVSWLPAFRGLHAATAAAGLTLLAATAGALVRAWTLPRRPPSG